LSLRQVLLVFGLWCRLRELRGISRKVLFGMLANWLVRRRRRFQHPPQHVIPVLGAVRWLCPCCHFAHCCTVRPQVPRNRLENPSIKARTGLRRRGSCLACDSLVGGDSGDSLSRHCNSRSDPSWRGSGGLWPHLGALEADRRASSPAPFHKERWLLPAPFQKGPPHYPVPFHKEPAVLRNKPGPNGPFHYGEPGGCRLLALFLCRKL
jgi:hypothetical protein